MTSIERDTYELIRSPGSKTYSNPYEAMQYAVASANAAAGASADAAMGAYSAAIGSAYSAAVSSALASLFG